MSAKPRTRVPRLTLLAAALGAAGLASLPAAAGPEGGSVRAGSASIVQNGNHTRIEQTSDRAVIDWRSFSVGATEQVLFAQPSAQSATLNRVTGDQLSLILGRVDANGQVYLVNPNGVVIGRGAELNVGGFVASAANIGNAEFMAGRLEFREAGRSDAAIVNEGRITAAEGGLVALVAPHVRNAGVIQARLGRVALGAGDTFALDLHGDGLVRLAVDANRARALLEHAGRIEADGGRVVLMSAAAARSALDGVVNLSGSVRADTVLEQGGRIVLSASGGSTRVSGSLSAQGQAAGQSGGTIEVLGERVQLAAGARLDASGAAAGGSVHVGGAWQGSGATPRASATTVEPGAQIAADARQVGGGGEVVVWSDGHTAYGGHISARGGAAAGDGGRVEVSGRATLDFAGTVDAGAAHGAAGSLLLDPLVMNIGLAEASLINRVLRTGTSTTVSAEQDINVNATIDGRGRFAGGGLTLDAGRDINLNEFIVTANGAVSLNARAGTVRFAPGRGIFAGNAPITVSAGADLAAGPAVTSNVLTLVSTGGSVDLDTPLGSDIGSVVVSAARDVRVNQPVVNIRNGSGFTANAGGDVLVNEQIDGRGGAAASGSVNLSAGGNVHFNSSVVTQLADIRARAIAGSIFSAAGEGLFVQGNAAGAPGGAIDLSAGSDFTTGILLTGGNVRLTSTGGAVTIGQGLAPTLGNVTLRAATDANLDTDILNLRSGATLAIDAGRDILVRAQIDGRGGVPGGSATLNAGRNIQLADNIVTNGGPISLTATAGTVNQAAGVQIRSGSAPISLTTGADLTTGSYVTTGALSLRSTGGSIRIAESIYDTVGATSINAANDVGVLSTARVENVRTLAPLAISAGRDIVIDGQIGQDRDATTATGAITMTATRNIVVNNDVVTRDAPLSLSATTGTVFVASQIAGQPLGVHPQVRAGSGPITVSAGADLLVGDPTLPKPNVQTPYVTTGALNLASTGGTLFLEAPIPSTTGAVTLQGGNAVVLNERVYSNNADITINAGAGGIVMNTSFIDVVHPVSGITFSTRLSDIDPQLGNLTLTARGDINAPSVRTAGTLTITSTEGRITSGQIIISRGPLGNTLSFPQRVILAGAAGIDSFDTASSPDVEARSSLGSVNLGVFAPQRLYIQAAVDIRTGGFIGSAVELVAGNDVLLGGLSAVGLLRANAGRDFSIAGDATINALSVSAGRDARFSSNPGQITWIEGAGGTMTLRDPAAAGAVATLRGIRLDAGRDVLFPTPLHVSDSLNAPDGIEANLQPTVISAGRHIQLEHLETIGSVAMSATTGNVTVNFPIGGPVPVLPPDRRLWNAAGVGVASLDIAAPGAGAVVSLQGARAVGDVSISAPNGTVNSIYAITSTAGTVTVNAAAQSISATPIPMGFRLPPPGSIAGAIAPGPLRAGPPGPEIAAAPAPGAPGLPEILVSAPNAIDALSLSAPGGGGAGLGDSTAEQVASAGRAAGAAGSTDETGGEERDAAGAVLIYSGGRGPAQTSDLGRSGTYGSARAPQGDEADDGKRRRRGSGNKR